jgi:hypothetical protein
MEVEEAYILARRCARQQAKTAIANAELAKLKKEAGINV